MFSHWLYDHMLVSVHVAGLPCTCAVMLFILHVLVCDWSRQMSIKMVSGKWLVTLGDFTCACGKFFPPPDGEEVCM